ncbi:DNA methyltransferase [Bacillus wiedmannii]|uniref:DNA adenine methylase n=1 Tax=Bacillus wiedmannii TaxID=1890302 RepID=UPI000BF871FC|nr:DNA adenine methylase [Bacillus wiedmannii]PEP51912.1 DNA methyltransferase [Bacillus wiedmannii]
MVNPSPLRYPGGKYKTYNYIKNLILANGSNIYIEPFAGGSAVSLRLLMDNVVQKIIINDYDRAIYAFWYSVIYRTDELIALINDTPINLETWYKQKEIQKNKENEDLLTLGFSTLFLNRTNRSGIIKAGIIGGKQQNGNYKMDCRFDKEKLIKKIKQISNFKQHILIYNMDAIDFINDVITKTYKSFTFFDPPYYHKGPSLYTNFYTHIDHYNLSKVIKAKMRNRTWIVTYDVCDEIKELYKNLSSQTFYLTYSAQTKRSSTEYMFFSKKVIIPENHGQFLTIYT